MFPREVGVPAAVNQDPVGAPTPRGNVGNETTPNVTRFFKRLWSETRRESVLFQRPRDFLTNRPPKAPPEKSDCVPSQGLRAVRRPESRGDLQCDIASSGLQ